MKRKFVLIINQLRIIKYILLHKQPEIVTDELFDCSVCGATNVKMYPVPAHYFARWQKYQTVHNPFFTESMNLAYYLCSKCFATDRDRLYALYMKDYLADAQQEIKLLDIAPSIALRNLLKNFSKILYKSMDLLKDDIDDKLDIMDMHLYKNEQFDFFICSHVLEHVTDDIKAMKELYRITKNAGKGIVMVPINLQLENTMEDATCTDTAFRIKYFIQDDHVRMYAKNDFVNRLTAAGFKVEQLGKNYFSEEVFDKYAIFPTSVLYVVKK